MEVVINGDQELKVTAQEAAMILDLVSTGPFNRVAPLIGKLMGQLKDNRPTEKSKDATPKGQRTD